MANYCGNVLNISSDDEQIIDRLMDATRFVETGFIARIAKPFFGSRDLNEHYGLLKFLRPMPLELKNLLSIGEKCDGGEIAPWYQWQLKNWGCAYDVAVEEANRICPNEVQFKFDSRYSPPIEAIAYGAKHHGFTFQLMYCETGNQFAGIASEKGHEEFNFSFDVHPLNEGVPQVIIDQFDLESAYEEALLDTER